MKEATVFAGRWDTKSTQSSPFWRERRQVRDMAEQTGGSMNESHGQIDEPWAGSFTRQTVYKALHIGSASLENCLFASRLKRRVYVSIHLRVYII